MNIIATVPRNISLLSCLATFFFIAQLTVAQTNSTYEQAKMAYSNGHYESAISFWRTFLADSQTNSKSLIIQSQLGIADAALKIGNYRLLNSSLATLAQQAEGVQQIQYLILHGKYYLVQEQYQQSIENLRRAQTLANTTKHISLQLQIYNELGNSFRGAGYTTEALQSYQQGLMLAQVDWPELALPALINILELRDTSLDSSTNDLWPIADKLQQRVTSDGTRLNYLLALSSLSATIRQQHNVSWLQTALALAQNTNNSRALSIVQAYLGEYYQQQNQYSEAINATEEAIVAAHTAIANDLLYRWQGQLADIYRQQNRYSEASRIYQQAINSLALVRQELNAGLRDGEAFFESGIRSLHLRYVDNLFAEAVTATNQTRQQSILRQARSVIETLKSAELQDYFGDECVLEKQEQQVELEAIAGDAAILYPIVLNDRLELLFSRNGVLTQFTVDVDAETLESTVEQFQQLLLQTQSERYLPYAQRLYRWFIAPISQQLFIDGTNVLVVVPDNIVGGISFAALHDGERFLAQKLATAITPSLQLTQPQALRQQSRNALIAGTEQTALGFTPLPHVQREMAVIQQPLAATVLSDIAYTKENLTRALQNNDYGIVHLATHGVIGNKLSESYLLSYDERISMDDLEQLLQLRRFQENPVELLTLSACETALGNSRAALGFAGIALKSGARSTLASLWLVDDASTALLMENFYFLWSTQQFTKAQALRQAQNELLFSNDFSHPGYWAAFQLIGNWL